MGEQGGIAYMGKGGLAILIDLLNRAGGRKVPDFMGSVGHRRFPSLPPGSEIGILGPLPGETGLYKECSMAHVVVASTQNLQQEIQAGKHRFFADEPVDAGGNDTGPDPYGLLLSALGA
jgi:hypothetical protein